MPKKYIVVLKSIGLKWFIFLVVSILIVFIYNQEVAIWMTGITIFLYLLSYIPSLFSKGKLLKLMKEYYMIEDSTIVSKLDKPFRKIQHKMFEMSQNQENKDWLIVYLEKHYIFFHAQTIEKFTELYHKGYSEKEILDEMKDHDLRTRAEVKSIIDTLKRTDRLGEREISVKKRREQLRFSS